MKVEESYDQLIARYQEKFDKITNLLTKAKTEAVKKYCSEMSSRLSVKAYFKNNEFNDIHYKSSRIGFEIFDSMTEFVRKEFNTESSNKIVLESHSEIRRKITTKKDYYKSLNDKNAPKTSTFAVYFGHQYISAATYDKKVDVVLDKSGRKLRPNSIAIGDEILYGFEAKDYYERTYLLKNFDIKQLLGRERKSFTNEELNSFPLKFSDNKLSVEVNYSDIKLDLSIESLLALIIDNIKTDAEKQFSKLMANVVITIPTNNTIIQRNLIRNVAKIAGFENIDIISELSAATIGYVIEKSKTVISNSRNVLFIIINRYDCDIAVCNIALNNIQFKAHFYKNLSSIESNSIFGQIIGNTPLSSYWSGNSHKNKTKKCFEELIVKTLRKANLEQKHIDEYVIAGDSQLIADLKEWMPEYFNLNLFNCDPIDIITSGAAIYSAMLSEKVKMIEISETNLYPIYYQLQRNKRIERRVEIINDNTLLPITKDFSYYLPKRTDLPLNISIFQEENLVMTHLIQTLPQPYDRWSHFLIEFNINGFGDIEFKAFVSNSSFRITEQIESMESDSGLNYREIYAEQQKLNFLNEKFEEKNKLSNEESIIEQTKIDLINYCIEKKEKFENDSNLRSLIRRQIIKEIDETVDLLKKTNFDLSGVKNQKIKLEKALEILLQ
jgi:molecular chaperone DnaK (HSP70)